MPPHSEAKTVGDGETLKKPGYHAKKLPRRKKPPRRVTLKMSPTRKAMPPKIQNSKTSNKKLS